VLLSAGCGCCAGLLSAGCGCGAGVLSAGCGCGAGVLSAGCGCGAGVLSAGCGCGAGVLSVLRSPLVCKRPMGGTHEHGVLSLTCCAWCALPCLPRMVCPALPATHVHLHRAACTHGVKHTLEPEPRWRSTRRCSHSKHMCAAAAPARQGHTDLCHPCHYSTRLCPRAACACMHTQEQACACVVHQQRTQTYTQTFTRTRAAHAALQHSADSVNSVAERILHMATTAEHSLPTLEQHVSGCAAGGLWLWGSDCVSGRARGRLWGL